MHLRVVKTSDGQIPKCVHVCVCVFTGCVLGFVLGALVEISLQNQAKVSNARLKHFYYSLYHRECQVLLEPGSDIILKILMWD